MRIITTMPALAALMLCAACANQSGSTASLADGSSQQFSALRWEEAISASQSAHVTNGNLISMR